MIILKQAIGLLFRFQPTLLLRVLQSELSTYSEDSGVDPARASLSLTLTPVFPTFRLTNLHDNCSTTCNEAPDHGDRDG